MDRSRMTDVPGTRCPVRADGRGLVVLLAALWLLPVLPAAAQPNAVAVPTEPTAAQAKRRIEDVENARSLTDEQRTAALDVYRQAQEHLSVVEEELARARELREAAERAPAQAKVLRDEAREPLPEIDDAHYRDLPLEAAEAELSAARTDKDTREARLAAAREQLDRIGASPRELRESYARTEQELGQRSPESANEPAPPDARSVEFARGFLAAARHRALAARAERLRTELLTLDARLDLANAQRDAATRALTAAEARVQALETVVGDARAVAAERVRQDAEAVAERTRGKHPVVQHVAAGNTALAKELSDVTAAQKALSDRRAAMEQRLRTVEEDFQAAQQRVNLAGLSSALGQVLREQRRALPDVRTVRNRIREREEAIARVSLALLRVDEALQALSVRERWIEAEAAAAGAALPVGDEGAAVARDLDALAADRRELLGKVRPAYVSQLNALTELEFAEQRLVARAREYAGFLDEHLLWIPSADPLGLATVPRLVAAVAWLVSPSNLLALVAAIDDRLLARPGLLAVLVVVVGLLLRWRRPLRERQARAAEAVSRASTDGLGHSLITALTCLVLAAPLALVTAFLGWRLGAYGAPDDHVAAVAAGLLGASMPLFLLRVFRHVYAKDGLAIAHFRWSEWVATKMRRYLRVLVFVVVPGVFLVRAMDAQPDLEFQSSLGRLAFLAVVLCLGFVMHELFHPARGVLHPYITRSRDTWMARLRHVWFALAVGIPVSLAGLAAYGYYYTALRLNEHQVATLRLVILAILLYHFVLRAIAVAERRLALKAKIEAEGEAVSDVSADGARVQLDVPVMDLDAINHQTRRLALIFIGWGVAVGLYFVWADVLPALNILDGVTLWDSSALVDGESVIKHITLGDILLTLVLGIVFTVAARNLPGVLEIAVLQHLPVDAGSRYAVTTISQYLIVAIGLIFIFQSLGVSWGQVQWLVAALGVGLGFGLQEIFANFISGIIILFERPVRIGDTVTLGDLTGTVSRIRIRATTVTDWDNKEIIIPNKSFITDRLINWTLSDSIMRVKIPVGIAYGSDTRLAYDVIWKAAGDNPRVLDEPAMQLFFLGFGESSLNFELRVFVGALSDLMKTTHELHMEINDALRENGIEIPFPQRDLHIRSAVPVPMQREPVGSPGPSPAGQGGDDRVPRAGMTDRGAGETEPGPAPGGAGEDAPGR